MESIGNRIRYLRKEILGKTQKQFGSQIGLKPNSVSDIESGKNTPTEQTIKAICREFNVNSDWIRAGKGEPIIGLSRNQEIAKFSNGIMELPDDNIKKKLILAISRLTSNDWNRLIEIIEDVLQTQIRREDQEKTD